jgi:hypothetical protein
MNDEGSNIWFPVNAFVKKPVSADVLLPEVDRLLMGVTVN